MQQITQTLFFFPFRWYVWGSLVSAFIAMIPLIDLSISIFDVPEATSLKAFDESATWVLLIISSIFFTIGSYVFVRAFESPPKPPLFTWRHFATDELLAAWLYLFAMSPYIPYAMFYINVNRHRYVYWGAFFASIFFVAASAFFVYTCYPSHHHLLVSATYSVFMCTQYLIWSMRCHLHPGIVMKCLHLPLTSYHNPSYPPLILH